MLLSMAIDGGVTEQYIYSKYAPLDMIRGEGKENADAHTVLYKSV